jgi:hypothetical protein
MKEIQQRWVQRPWQSRYQTSTTNPPIPIMPIQVRHNMMTKMWRHPIKLKEHEHVLQLPENKMFRKIYGYKNKMSKQL